MTEIPTARQSPRLSGGVLKWYEGDTFTLDLTLDAADQDGEPITIPASAALIVQFFDSRRSNIKTFTCTNIQNNSISLDFDADVSALFRKGNYTYDIIYEAGRRATIVNDNPVMVE